MHILWRSSLEFPVSLSVLKLLALMSREARVSGNVAHLDLKVLPLMMMELCYLNCKLLPLMMMMMKRYQKEMPCLEKRELCLDKGMLDTSVSLMLYRPPIITSGATIHLELGRNRGC